MNLEYGLAPSGHPIKRALRKLGIVSRAFEKVYAKCVLIEIQICERCSFIQTKTPFSEESIGHLYADYRSATYNQERIQYEPEYASIAPCVGRGAQEVETRKTGLTQWLKGKFDSGTHLSMLDYGGADGMFLPDLPGRKYVFDISDVGPCNGVTKIMNESELGSYAYIQLAHVLEHVPNPLVLTKKAASFLKDSGCLYVEVPQELDDQSRARLESGDYSVRLPIHEHINQYCLRSVTELLRSAGLSPVSIEAETVDLGWNRGTIIRALGRKT